MKSGSRGGEQESEVGEVVLDASAVLTTLQSEPGADVVDAVAHRAVILTVNLSEAAAKLIPEGMPVELAKASLQALGIPSVPFDDDLAFLAASLVVQSKKAGLSLGDLRTPGTT